MGVANLTYNMTDSSTAVVEVISTSETVTTTTKKLSVEETVQKALPVVDRRQVGFGSLANALSGLEKLKLPPGPDPEEAGVKKIFKALKEDAPKAREDVHPYEGGTFSAHMVHMANCALPSVAQVYCISRGRGDLFIEKSAVPFTRPPSKEDDDTVNWAWNRAREGVKTHGARSVGVRTDRVNRLTGLHTPKLREGECFALVTIYRSPYGVWHQIRNEGESQPGQITKGLPKFAVSRDSFQSKRLARFILPNPESWDKVPLWEIQTKDLHRAIAPSVYRAIGKCALEELEAARRICHQQACYFVANSCLKIFHSACVAGGYDFVAKTETEVGDIPIIDSVAQLTGPNP